MKLKKILFLTIALLFFGCAEDPIVPLIPCEGDDCDPPLVAYCNLSIISDTILRPSHRTQAQLDADVMRLYNGLRNSFLRNIVNERYSFFAAGGTGINGGRALTNSETHGYGMIILVLASKMGGVGDERAIFDRMNALRKTQGSATAPRTQGGTNHLMSWVIHGSLEHDTIITDFENRICWDEREECWERFGRSSSATDGDMDMAYALLLAYDHWGDVQYKNDAIDIIGSIKELNMHPSLFRTNLGDWHGRWSATTLAQRTTSRTSDWMPGHFRAFYRATGDIYWSQAADEVYIMLGRVANQSTGLMADFIIGERGEERTVASAAEAIVAGEHNWYNYSFNACRVPWRLALDWVQYLTPQAKYHINKISCWLSAATGGNPANIRSCYQLDGTSCGTHNSLAFVAPFASGMLADAANQGFLNRTYDNIVERHSGGFYNDALRLLNLFLITGNWQAPRWQ